jgi:hypothetical protein
VTQLVRAVGQDLYAKKTPWVKKEREFWALPDREGIP